MVLLDMRPFWMTITLATCQPNYTDRTLRQITGVLPHLSDQSHVDVRAPFFTVPTIQDDLTGPVVTRLSTTRTHPQDYSAPAISGTTIGVLASYLGPLRLKKMRCRTSLQT
ncbi:hypothetical protein ARMGADRAFT_1092851 [Armillaria gallica]|uniref:Uncharacterized protein n=1 Tax=Armillaria gallica TaxID=47427 RepID=A0A2H3CSL1_ARMGA|nr:hypothetical protein ARMGADRAFT_1092851 [Armillaria gallica]